MCAEPRFPFCFCKAVGRFVPVRPTSAGTHWTGFFFYLFFKISFQLGKGGVQTLDDLGQLCLGHAWLTLEAMEMVILVMGCPPSINLGSLAMRMVSISARQLDNNRPLGTRRNRFHHLSV